MPIRLAELNGLITPYMTSSGYKPTGAAAAYRANKSADERAAMEENGRNQRAASQQGFARDQLNMQQEGAQLDRDLASEQREQQQINKLLRDYHEAVGIGDKTSIRTLAEELKASGAQSVEIPDWAEDEEPTVPSAPDSKGKEKPAQPPAPAPAVPQPSLDPNTAMPSKAAFPPVTDGSVRPEPTQSPPVRPVGLDPNAAQLNQTRAQAAPQATQAPAGAGTMDVAGSAGSLWQDQAKPKPKNLRVVGRDGKVLSEINMADIRREQEARIAGTFGAYEAQASSPVEKKAAQLGRKVATERLGTMGLKDAIAAGEDAFNKQMGRVTAQSVAATRAGGNYGGTGMSKDSYNVTDDKVDRVERIVQRNKQEFGYKSLVTLEQDMAKLYEAANQNNGLGDLTAITSLVSGLQGRVSDADMRQAMAAGGLEGQMSNLFGYVAKEGKKDRKYMQNLRDMAKSLAGTAKVTRENAAAKTEQDIKDVGVPLGWAPDEVETLGGLGYNMMGGARRRELQRRGAGGRPANSNSPAPKGDTKAPEKAAVKDKWGL